jgi:hypothetical protein
MTDYNLCTQWHQSIELKRAPQVVASQSPVACEKQHGVISTIRKQTHIRIKSSNVITTQRPNSSKTLQTPRSCLAPC